MRGEGFPSKSKVPGPGKSGLFCLPHAPDALEVFSILGCRSRSGPHGALGHLQVLPCHGEDPTGAAPSFRPFPAVSLEACTQTSFAYAQGELSEP